MRNKWIRSLVLSAMFFALGLVLPFVTGQIPQVGQMLLPMHLPVFLCSLICGWQFGLPVGLLLPVVRSMLFGMPPFFPNAVAMSAELAAYGFFAGFFYKLFLKMGWKKLVAVLVSLILAMILGRLVWGGVMWLIMNVNGKGFTIEQFLAGAVLNAIPGIIIQIVLVPTIMMTLDRQNNILS